MNSLLIYPFYDWQPPLPLPSLNEAASNMSPGACVHAFLLGTCPRVENCSTLADNAKLFSKAVLTNSHTHWQYVSPSCFPSHQKTIDMVRLSNFSHSGLYAMVFTMF